MISMENVKTFKHHIARILMIHPSAVEHIFRKARAKGILTNKRRGVNALLPSVHERKLLLRFIVAERFPDYRRQDLVFNRPDRWMDEGCVGISPGGITQRTEIPPMAVRLLMTFGGVASDKVEMIQEDA